MAEGKSIMDSGNIEEAILDKSEDLSEKYIAKLEKKSHSKTKILVFIDSWGKNWQWQRIVW